MPEIRLDRFLSEAGMASRRALKDIIRSGRVTVDGCAETRPETKLDPERSAVCLDGKRVAYAQFRYFMLDKPVGVLTATRDGRQKTVLDLLPPALKRLGLFPVGRLDKDTSGLLLLTNDGDFAHRVISPKFCVEKLYYAKVDGALSAEDAAAFKQGLILRDGARCLPAALEILGEGACLVKVREGKYHQVRRMLASRGAPVLELRRLSVGGLVLGENLGPGGLRELFPGDLCRVFNAK